MNLQTSLVDEVNKLMTIKSIIYESRSQNDSTVDMILALHAAEENYIPAIQYGPHYSVRSNP